MENFPIFFATVLTTLAAYFLVRPFLREAESASDDGGAGARTVTLLEQKHRFLQLLKDLELDNAMRKISSGDYEQMRRELSSELGGVLAKLEALPEGRNAEKP